MVLILIVIFIRIFQKKLKKKHRRVYPGACFLFGVKMIISGFGGIPCRPEARRLVLPAEFIRLC
jgi:hypothetical protein